MMSSCRWYGVRSTWALVIVAMAIGSTTSAIGADRVVLGEYFNATW